MLRTESLTGQEIYTLAPEAMLLFLCAHGSKHMCERLAWICDIARFLMVTRDLDWDAVVEHSSRTRTLRQLLLGVRLSAEVFHVYAPVDLPKDPALEPLVRLRRPHLARNPRGFVCGCWSRSVIKCVSCSGNTSLHPKPSSAA